MNETLIHNLETILMALNNVEVKGKANLANLSGSIAMLEHLISGLQASAQDAGNCSAP